VERTLCNLAILMNTEEEMDTPKDVQHVYLIGVAVIIGTKIRG